MMVQVPTPPSPKPLSPAILSAYGMSRYVYFDIETIPNQRPETLEKLRSQITAPSQYKKPESIEKWLDENRERAALEALAKTSFDGGAGHACTIAWAKNDGDIRVEHAETVGEESEIITAFFADLDPYHSEILVGHNIAKFDIPFLLKRAVVLGAGLPGPSSFPRDPKPWSDGIFDTMVAWAGARDFISMNVLCGILGIVGKDDFDGSQVAAAWANGEHMRIAEYCDSDVSRTRSMHQKFLEAGWPDGVTRQAQKDDLPVIDDEIPTFEGAEG